MPFLFDTDAVSESFRPRPLAAYLAWLRTVPRAEQYTSAVVVAELFAGAYMRPDRDIHMRNLRDRVLPQVTVLPFDVAAAEAYGRIRAALRPRGRLLADADMQIAATALAHDLELVTGNVRHFDRVPGLAVCRVLAEARAAARRGG